MTNKEAKYFALNWIRGMVMLYTDEDEAIECDIQEGLYEQKDSQKIKSAFIEIEKSLGKRILKLDPSLEMLYKKLSRHKLLNQLKNKPNDTNRNE